MLNLTTTELKELAAALNRFAEALEEFNEMERSKQAGGGKGGYPWHPIIKRNKRNDRYTSLVGRETKIDLGPFPGEYA